MKTYTSYEQVPEHAIYLGSEDGNGYMSESLDDLINQAMNPVRLREDDGTYAYFDLEEYSNES